MNGCSTDAHSSPQELGTPEEQSSPGSPQHAAFKGASRSDSSAKLVHGAAWSSGDRGAGGGGGGGGGGALSEQSLPKKPGAQVQVNCCSLRCPPPFPPLGVHRPPFWQGFGWQTALAECDEESSSAQGKIEWPLVLLVLDPAGGIAPD